MKSARERPQKAEVVGWQGERERKRVGRERAGGGAKGARQQRQSYINVRAVFRQIKIKL